MNSDRWTQMEQVAGAVWGSHMAAVVRGGHARQGGRGRAHGRGGAAAAAEPGQGRVNPPNYQWLMWRAGNTNRISTSKSRKDEDETARIFRELEDSQRVDRQELNSYGIPPRILGQPHEVMRIIQGMVTQYNVMADLRRRYLWRTLHGYQGKETSSILKKVQVHQENEVNLQEDVEKQGGYCPPTPTILTTLPKLR